MTQHTTQAEASQRRGRLGRPFGALLGILLPIATVACPLDPQMRDKTPCISCHQDDLLRHHGAFPTDCQRCHSQDAWKPARFDHSRFPLIGTHAKQPCSRCHASSQPPPTTCIGCHQEDLTRPRQPLHTTPGFPTDCRYCHSQIAWKPAASDHSKFPLTGQHAALSCTACHPNPENIAQPTATTCIGCHQKLLSSATFPNHLAAGFSTDCASCHNTNAWKPAAFDHSRYFTLTGPHAVTCASCHLDPANPSSYSCEGTCHVHTPEKMSSVHQGIKGHSSKPCAECHR